MTKHNVVARGSECIVNSRPWLQCKPCLFSYREPFVRSRERMLNYKLKARVENANPAPRSTRNHSLPLGLPRTDIVPVDRKLGARRASRPVVMATAWKRRRKLSETKQLWQVVTNFEFISVKYSRDQSKQFLRHRLVTRRGNVQMNKRYSQVSVGYKKHFLLNLYELRRKRWTYFWSLY